MRKVYFHFFIEYRMSPYMCLVCFTTISISIN